MTVSGASACWAPPCVAASHSLLPVVQGAHWPCHGPIEVSGSRIRLRGRLVAAVSGTAMALASPGPFPGSSLPMQPCPGGCHGSPC